MRKRTTHLIRVALVGAVVVPALLASSGRLTRAAGPVTITVTYQEFGPPASYTDDM